MNRRSFLRCVAAASGAPMLAASPTPNCKFPSDPQKRLAVASYPFRKDIAGPKATMKLLDFPKMVAERFHVSGIEPLDEHFPSTDSDYLAKFRQALNEAGAHVVNIPVGRLHGSFYDPDETKRETAITNGRQWIDVAATLGSPGVRLHIQGVNGLKPDSDRAAQSLRTVALYGQQKGIVVNLENDDPSTEDAFFIADVIHKAGTPWLRALPDFCNSMLLNKGEEYNTRAMEALFPLSCNISHVKEIETDSGKQYKIDLSEIFQIAKSAHYRGFFSMEWDSDGDPYAGTESLISSALKALS